MHGSAHLCDKMSGARQNLFDLYMYIRRLFFQGIESTPAHFPSRRLQRQPVHRLTAGPNRDMKLVLLCCPQG